MTKSLTDRVYAALEKNGGWMSQLQIRMACKLDSKQASNILYRLTENEELECRSEPGGKLWRVVQMEPKPGKKAPTSSPLPKKVEELMENFSQVVADGQTYRNALLQIQQIIEKALGKGE